ncbi:MAG TPA: hypothetical protein PK250_07555 [Syntrophobacter fumaroxidans]|nr:hypothetical protein [Syntrophobacter fumaroxidans]
MELLDEFPICFQRNTSLFFSNHFTKERLQRVSEINQECEAAWEFNLREPFSKTDQGRMGEQGIYRSRSKSNGAEAGDDGDDTK